MKIVTRKQRAAGVAKSWKYVYHDKRYGNWGGLNQGDPREIYEDLLNLGEEPEPEEVDRVIGNGSWTRMTCQECEKSVETAVSVGMRYLCEECVGEATGLFREHRETASLSFISDRIGR